MLFASMTTITMVHSTWASSSNSTMRLPIRPANEGLPASRTFKTWISGLTWSSSLRSLSRPFSQRSSWCQGLHSPTTRISMQLSGSCLSVMTRLHRACGSLSACWQQTTISTWKWCVWTQAQKRMVKSTGPRSSRAGTSIRRPISKKSYYRCLKIKMAITIRSVSCLCPAPDSPRLATDNWKNLRPLRHHLPKVSLMKKKSNVKLRVQIYAWIGLGTSWSAVDSNISCSKFTAWT